jgi:alginate O-acetyltransferase complex protein AlgI
LLVGSIIANHEAATRLAILRHVDPRRGRRLLHAVIALDVLALGVWKYGGFAASQASNIFGAIGVGLRPSLHLALPIAISFYTFQCISYVADVWRGTADPAPRLLDFAAYILLFPHLIAGPIVRYSHIEADLLHPASRRLDDFAMGAPRFFWGLAKKVLIADQVAAVANVVFSLPDNRVTTGVAWVGVLAYAVQIYFDFSGYSDMAIGLARMFGFAFPENFDRPYSAQSVTDFWRRWHMSLSSWFRDYVYIPLGGSRRGRARTYLNLWTVFLLTGMWHGANWTFIVWGCFHGACLIVERLTGLGTTDATRLVWLRRLVTFALVCVGWALFRARNLGQAWTVIHRMVVPSGLGLPVAVTEVLSTQRTLWFAIGLAVVALPPRAHIGRVISLGSTRRSEALRMAVLVTVAPLAALYALSSTFSPFLYFKF